MNRSEGEASTFRVEPAPPTFDGVEPAPPEDGDVTPKGEAIAAAAAVARGVAGAEGVSPMTPLTLIKNRGRLSWNFVLPRRRPENGSFQSFQCARPL